MKLKKLNQRLKERGFTLIRQNKHNIYSNGIKTVAVPNHKEINEMLAKRILKEINYEDEIL